MVDFSKLRDPAYLAQAKARREEEESRQEARKTAIDAALKLCTDRSSMLTAREQEFIRSAHRTHNSFSQLTPPQVKWLGDIEERVIARTGFITISQGMRGWFAVHVTTDEDGCMSPESTGFGSYGSPEATEPEAMSWAESEGIPFVTPSQSSPLTLKEFLAAQISTVVPLQVVPKAPADLAATSPAGAVELEPSRGRAIIEAARARARGPR